MLPELFWFLQKLGCIAYLELGTGFRIYNSGLLTFAHYPSWRSIGRSSEFSIEFCFGLSFPAFPSFYSSFGCLLPIPDTVCSLVFLISVSLYDSKISLVSGCSSVISTMCNLSTFTVFS